MPHSTPISLAPILEPASGWAALPRAPGYPLYGNLDFGAFVRTVTIDDLTLDVTSHQAGTDIPEHPHPTLLLLLVLDGEIEEITSGVVSRARPGSLLVRPAGAVHAVRCRRVSRLFTIEPGPAWLDRIGASAVAGQLVSGDWTDRLAPLALKVYAAFARFDSGPAAPLALGGYLQALLAELAQPHGNAATPLWLRDVCRHLDQNLAEPLDLDSLARVAGVHPVHLSRSFRKHFGHTLTDYLRQGRLSAASALLSTTDEPIAVIARRLGFADQSHLARVFRNAIGATPVGYRAALRERPLPGTSRRGGQPTKGTSKGRYHTSTILPKI